MTRKKVTAFVNNELLCYHTYYGASQKISAFLRYFSDILIHVADRHGGRSRLVGYNLRINTKTGHPFRRIRFRRGILDHDRSN